MTNLLVKEHAKLIFAKSVTFLAGERYVFKCGMFSCAISHWSLYSIPKLIFYKLFTICSYECVTSFQMRYVFICHFILVCKYSIPKLIFYNLLFLLIIYEWFTLFSDKSQQCANRHFKQVLQNCFIFIYGPTSVILSNAICFHMHWSVNIQ